MDELLERIGLLIKARYPLLYLLSYEEERVRRGLARLADREDFAVYGWRSSTGLETPDGKAVPDTMAPTAALAHVAEIEESALFVFHDLHPALTDAGVVRWLRDLEPRLGSRHQAILLLSPLLLVPPELEKDVRVLDVPLPGRPEVERILQRLLGRQGITLTDDLLSRYVQTSLGLTERELKRAYASILLDGGRFTEEDLQKLVASKCEAIRRTPGLEYLPEIVDVADVGGLDNLKRWLKRRSRAFEDEARSFGLPEPKGVFLLGVQGCGKSLTAKSVASHFSIPLLRLDVGAVFQSSGGAEGTLREAIRIAESIAPVVLWIDELEKGFLATSQEGGGREFGTFLTWLQEKKRPVFVVATANEVRVLPPELLRKGRFDEIFFVDLPDVHERLEILDIHLRARGRDPEAFDLLRCAEESEKYSGAELEQVVVEGLFDAYAETRELVGRDLLRVIRDTVPLAITMDDRLKELREWARPRTRPATLSRRRLDFFQELQEIPTVVESLSSEDVVPVGDEIPKPGDEW